MEGAHEEGGESLAGAVDGDDLAQFVDDFGGAGEFEVEVDAAFEEGEAVFVVAAADGVDGGAGEVGEGGAAPFAEGFAEGGDGFVEAAFGAEGAGAVFFRFAAGGVEFGGVDVDAVGASDGLDAVAGGAEFAAQDADGVLDLGLGVLGDVRAVDGADDALERDDVVRLVEEDREHGRRVPSGDGDRDAVDADFEGSEQSHVEDGHGFRLHSHRGRGCPVSHNAISGAFLEAAMAGA